MLACIPAILISIILCIYAKKDIHDHIIPYNWWIAGVIPAVLGITLVIAEPTPFIVLRTQITVSICILLFALGFVRLLNMVLTRVYDIRITGIFAIISWLLHTYWCDLFGCCAWVRIDDGNTKRQIVSHSYFRLLLRQDVPLYQF